MSGITNYSQCPTKSEIIDKSISVGGTYADNQLVELSDVGGGGSPQLEGIDYIGYGISKDDAYNTSIIGKLYEDNGNYYSNQEGTVPATEGYYLIIKGARGAPGYSDSEFIYVMAW